MLESAIRVGLVWAVCACAFGVTVLVLGSQLTEEILLLPAFAFFVGVIASVLFQKMKTIKFM